MHALLLTAALAGAAIAAPAPMASATSSSEHAHESHESEGGEWSHKSANDWYPHGHHKNEGVDVTATFDDINPVILVAPLALSDIGPYYGLDFQGIDVLTAGLNGQPIVGIEPNTSPNIAAFDFVDVLTGGDAPAITANFDGSYVDRFDFKKFYFACTAGAIQDLVAPGLDCNLNVTGYRDGKRVARQQFNFDGDLLSLGGVEMTEAKLNKKFRNIDSVHFETSYDDETLAILGGLVGTTFVDTLDFTLYFNEKVDEYDFGSWEKENKHDEEHEVDAEKHDGEDNKDHDEDNKEHDGDYKSSN